VGKEMKRRNLLKSTIGIGLIAATGDTLAKDESILEPGGVYAYIDEFVEGIKSTNMVAVGVKNNWVMITEESIIDRMVSPDSHNTMVVGRMKIEDFRKWYPKLLYNYFDKV
jgi:hypothetical protein